MHPKKIAVFGAPYTGKTELSQALQKALPNSYCLPEYARVYITRYGPPEHPAEQLYMIEQMADIERVVSRLHDYVIIDTPLPVYAIYGIWHVDAQDRAKTEAFRGTFSRMAKKYAYSYDHVYFLPDSEITYTKDNLDAVRVLSPEERKEISKRIRLYCVEHLNSYKVLSGTTEERVATVLKDIGMDQ